MTRIPRDENGVPKIEATSQRELYRMLGTCHATDRGMQMLLMRILGRGQASEFLDSSDELLEVDRFFRRMNWTDGAAGEAAKLDSSASAACTAYCDGVNSRFERRIPLELKLVGYRPDPWTIADCMLIARMTGYITLAASQGEIERLIVQMVQAGVDQTRLEELFPGMLGGLDIELLRRVKLTDRIVPEYITWGSAAPRMMASNNWVIAGSRTASGKPLFANDPHLEVNRLPNVWYEVTARAPDLSAYSATMPGLPALLLGRTEHLAWGATYTFMDAVDSWIEDCQGGCYRRGESEWKPFRTRHETIARKKKPAVEVVFHENDHGVLDGDPGQAGLYLTTRWASAYTGARSLNAMIALPLVKNVDEGMSLLGQLEPSFNWVLADREGNIGYQMSGLMPKRRDGVTGLVPLPGWDVENDWQGFVQPEDLPRRSNPPEGYIVTANQDLNDWGRARPINAPMGPYRAERITELLAAAHEPLTVSDMQKIQYDVYSLQAERFMEILRPLLPETEPARILAAWDYRYHVDSLGADLFERVYHALFDEVFGERTFGRPVAAHLRTQTGIFADFYDAFDRVLLSARSEWFKGEARDDVYRRVLAETLISPPRRWGSSQKLSLKNIFFGGKLPAWLGFDRGPFEIAGGRATVSQGQIYRSAGRDTSFLPSVRIVTDLASSEVISNIAGGPSDRRFSRWYASDLTNWLTGRYKTLRL